MKIGIISDTHIKDKIDKFEVFLKNNLMYVDVIIHVGDYINYELIGMIKKYKKFIGVFGNVDDDRVKDLVKEREIVDLLGYKIGVYHGHGKGKTTIDRAYDSFLDDDVDIIVFGHSHQPIIKTKNKKLLLNPGSPTSKRRERWFSYIILEIDNTKVDASLKFFT